MNVAGAEKNFYTDGTDCNGFHGSGPSKPFSDPCHRSAADLPAAWLRQAGAALARRLPSHPFSSDFDELSRVV